MSQLPEADTEFHAPCEAAEKTAWHALASGGMAQNAASLDETFCGIFFDRILSQVRTCRTADHWAYNHQFRARRGAFKVFRRWLCIADVQSDDSTRRPSGAR